VLGELGVLVVSSGFLLELRRSFRCRVGLPLTRCPCRRCCRRCRWRCRGRRGSICRELRHVPLDRLLVSVPLRDLLDAPTALAACCGFDLCHKYILYLYFRAASSRCTPRSSRKFAVRAGRFCRAFSASSSRAVTRAAVREVAEPIRDVVLHNAQRRATAIERPRRRPLEARQNLPAGGGFFSVLRLRASFGRAHLYLELGGATTPDMEDVGH
jgi:hypothetical protein